MVAPAGSTTVGSANGCTKSTDPPPTPLPHAPAHGTTVAHWTHGRGTLIGSAQTWLDTQSADGGVDLNQRRSDAH